MTTLTGAGLDTDRPSGRSPLAASRWRTTALIWRLRPAVPSAHATADAAES